MLNKDHLLDELRRVEQDVVEGERQLAEQEKMLVLLTDENEDLLAARTQLEALRAKQQALQQDRLRILSLLQP